MKQKSGFLTEPHGRRDFFKVAISLAAIGLERCFKPICSTQRERLSEVTAEALTRFPTINITDVQEFFATKPDSGKWLYATSDIDCPGENAGKKELTFRFVDRTRDHLLDAALSAGFSREQSSELLRLAQQSGFSCSAIAAFEASKGKSFYCPPTPPTREEEPFIMFFEPLDLSKLDALNALVSFKNLGDVKVGVKKVSATPKDGTLAFHFAIVPDGKLQYGSVVIVGHAYIYPKIHKDDKTGAASSPDHGQISYGYAVIGNTTSLSQ